MRERCWSSGGVCGLGGWRRWACILMRCVLACLCVEADAMRSGWSGPHRRGAVDVRVVGGRVRARLQLFLKHDFSKWSHYSVGIDSRKTRTHAHATNTRARAYARRTRAYYAHTTRALVAQTRPAIHTHTRARAHTHTHRTHTHTRPKRTHTRTHAHTHITVITQAGFSRTCSVRTGHALEEVVYNNWGQRKCAAGRASPCCSTVLW